MRSDPWGCRRTQTVRPIPYATAIAEQMRANSTAWSLKKSMLPWPPVPSQSCADPARRDGSFYHKGSVAAAVLLVVDRLQVLLLELALRARLRPGLPLFRRGRLG